MTHIQAIVAEMQGYRFGGLGSVPIAKVYEWADRLESLAPLAPASGEAEVLAIRFHEIYERLAPTFGYETRPDTKAFDPTSANGRLMIAVCAEIQTAPPIAPAVSVGVDKECIRSMNYIAWMREVGGMEPPKDWQDGYREGCRITTKEKCCANFGTYACHCNEFTSPPTVAVTELPEENPIAYYAQRIERSLDDNASNYVSLHRTFLANAAQHLRAYAQAARSQGVTVDDAMVERAFVAYWSQGNEKISSPVRMRAALEAALLIGKRGE